MATVKKRKDLIKKYSSADKKWQNKNTVVQKKISPKEIQARWEKKAIQVETLAKHIQSLKYNITRDLQSDDEKVFLTASAIDLMIHTGERVGNEGSASNGHVGITGLEKSNIKISGNTINLIYTGKSGVEHDKIVTDKRLANNLRKCKKISSTALVFCTSEGFCIKADKINRYLKDFGVTAKDVRGFSANKWVIDKLKYLDIEDTAAKRKKEFLRVVKQVAQKVGHGPATLRNQYLIPNLEQQYVENGKLIDIKEMSKGGQVYVEDTKKMRTGGVIELVKPEVKVKEENQYLAPNGKASKLTPEQWNLVRTSEFKHWFGDWEKAYATGNYKGVSKGVDANGEPMVFYHGTNRHFNEFKWNKNRNVRNKIFQGDGFYFTDDAMIGAMYSEAAVNHALLRDEFYKSLDKYYPKPIAQMLKYQVEMPYTQAWEKAEEEFGGREKFFKTVRAWEKETNLDINNASDYTEYVEGSLRGADESNSFVNIFGNNINSIPDFLIEEADRYHFKNALPDFHVIEVFLKMVKPLKTKNRARAINARENGFDSLIYSGVGTVLDSTEYAVYDATQIKLADGTNKTFGTNNPDIRYKDGGAMDKLLAPNGKVSNLSPEQYKLVRTSEFKKWFGDWEYDAKNASRVVDENGEPLLMYHGSLSEDITQFKYDKMRGDDYDAPFNGFWFSNNKNTSPAFVDPIKVYKVFLNLRNPCPPDIYKKVSQDIYYSDDKFNGGTGNQTRLKLMEMGYDGVVWAAPPIIDEKEYNQRGVTEFYSVRGTKYTIKKNEDNDGADLYSEYSGYITGYIDCKDVQRSFREITIVIFKDSNIKLADGTNKNFDANNPDIRYKKGGAVVGLLAPNGKVSNLPPEQYRLVRTPEFKKWFGDWEGDAKNSSKVIDENGEPLVVYHGTKSKRFYIFDNNKLGQDSNILSYFGFHFTRDKRMAEGLFMDPKKSTLYECFLNIRKPIENKEEYFVRNAVADGVSAQMYREDAKIDMYALDNMPYFSISQSSFANTMALDSTSINPKLKHKEIALLYLKKLKSEGYDGVFYQNQIEWASDHRVDFIAFEPNQIKLADCTNSTFDSSTPDIRYEKGGEVKKYDAQLISVEAEVLKVLGELNAKGCQSLIVGGAVRDAILGIAPKDIDIEVYNISYADLSDFLAKYGTINLVGKSFGVIKFKPFAGEMEYDFSVPRKENKIGIGHKSFEVSFDETMTIKDAALRRDFTFNSLAYDPITNTVYDYFGGISDIENKIIRHTSDKFSEDALRILRAMQFQARFDFSIAPETIQLMREMLMGDDFKSLPKERIFEEWYKWASKGVRHDVIFDFLRDTSLIEYYPELKLLKETPQDHIYHPEGDVEIHTTLCLRYMDKIISENNINGEEKAVLVMAILLHDIAKPPTTQQVFKNGRMTITSNGHEELGGEISKKILWGMGFHADLITPISNLVATHLAGVHIISIPEERSKVKAVKKLAIRLHPANIKQLLHVMTADHNGRGSDVYKVPTGYEDLSRIAESADVTEKPFEYLLKGRHLIELGMKPSIEFGKILRAANEAQINGEYSTVDEGRVWLKAYIENMSAQ